MKTNRTATLVLTLSLLAGAFAAPQAAQAGQFSLFGAPLQPMALAYAPESGFETQDDGRFDQFESEEEMHELNDAWLGMPARDNAGRLIGFIEDAWIDDNGDVSELLVSLTDNGYAVYIEGSVADLGDAAVAINLSATSIAALERADDFQLVQR